MFLCKYSLSGLISFLVLVCKIFASNSKDVLIFFNNFNSFSALFSSQSMVNNINRFFNIRAALCS